MLYYFLNRLLQGLVVIIIVSAIVFLLSRLTGDPLALSLPMNAKEEDFTRARQELGLDRPLYVQYGIFLKDAVQGDFGRSIRTGEPVGKLIRQRLPNSLSLSAAAIGFALIVAIPLGVISAVKRGSLIDGFARVLALLGQVVPSFWLGIILMLIFSVQLKLLPTSGTGSPLHYILPAFTMGWLISAGIVRLLRSSMLEVLDSEYIKLARAKGVKERTVIWKHAFRNALIPVITYVGLMFALVIAAAVVVETVFNWPGIGRLFFTAIGLFDTPVIVGLTVIYAYLLGVTVFLLDFIYALVDPRVKVSGTGGRSA